MKRLLAIILAVLILSASAFAATWTTAVVRKTVTDDRGIIVDVSFSNGTVKFVRTYEFRDTSDSLKQLQSRVQAEIDVQDALEVSSGKIAVGPLVLPTVNPPVPDAARDAFLVALALYRHTKNSFDAGVATQGELDSAKSDLKAKFKPAYLVYF